MLRPNRVIPENVIGKKIPAGEITFRQKQSILFAVGIGFSQDPLKAEDYKFTNEFHPHFTTFPTILSCLAQKQVFELILENQDLPLIEMSQLLHLEEKLFLVSGKVMINIPYTTEVEIIDIQDKGKNAYIITRIYGYTRNKQLAFYLDRNHYIRGLGGFQFKGNGKSGVFPILPSTKQNDILESKSFPGQAFIYRLNSDYNLLHIDPQVAKSVGFEKSILHGINFCQQGLASQGTVLRSIVQNVLENSVDLIESIQTRFLGHVYPGESFKIKIWQRQNKIYYDAYVVQRKTKALIGCIGLKSQPKL